MGIIGEAKKTMTCIKTKFKTKIRNLKKVVFSQTPGKKYTVDTGEARKVRVQGKNPL